MPLIFYHQLSLAISAESRLCRPVEAGNAHTPARAGFVGETNTPANKTDDSVSLNIAAPVKRVSDMHDNPEKLNRSGVDIYNFLLRVDYVWYTLSLSNVISSLMFFSCFFPQFNWTPTLRSVVFFNCYVLTTKLHCYKFRWFHENLHATNCFNRVGNVTKIYNVLHWRQRSVQMCGHSCTKEIRLLDAPTGW